MGFKRHRGNRPGLFRFRNGIWEHKHEQHWYYHPAMRTHRVRKEESSLSMFEGCIVKTTYACERLMSDPRNSRVGVVRKVRPVEWGHLADIILDTGEKSTFDVRNLELCGNGWYGRALAERIDTTKKKVSDNYINHGFRRDVIAPQMYGCDEHKAEQSPHSHCSCRKWSDEKFGEKETTEEESKTTIRIEGDGGYQIVSGQKTIYMSHDEAPCTGIVDIYTLAGAYCGKAELRECVMPNKMVYSYLSKKAVNHVPYELFSVHFWIFKPLETLYEGDHVEIRGETATGIVVAVDGDKARVETVHGTKTVLLGELTLATHEDKPNA